MFASGGKGDFEELGTDFEAGGLRGLLVDLKANGFVHDLEGDDTSVALANSAVAYGENGLSGEGLQDVFQVLGFGALDQKDLKAFGIGRIGDGGDFDGAAVGGLAPHDFLQGRSQFAMAEDTDTDRTGTRFGGPFDEAREVIDKRGFDACLDVGLIGTSHGGPIVPSGDEDED